MNEPLESNNPVETPIETSAEKKAALTKNRRKLVFLFAIAIVPMFVAYGLFFYFPDLIPASTTNEGVLIQPPLSGVTLGLIEPVVEPRGVWTMLIPVAATCSEQCQQRLYLSRQIKIGLGKDADRIERIALLSIDPSTELQALLAAEHGDLTAQVFSSQALQSALQRRLPGATGAEYLLLMDPNGNIMMFYSFEKIGAPLRKDIKHLLKISNIG